MLSRCCHQHLYIFLQTFFTKDQEVISVSVKCLRFLSLVYPLVAIAITSGRVMQGLGRGLPVLVITIIRVLGVSAPLGIYFSFYLLKPVEWNWYAMIVAAIIAFIIAIFWVTYEIRKINENYGGGNESFNR